MINGIEHGFRGWERWFDTVWYGIRNGIVRGIRPHR